jgi:hypothetical protein
MTGRLSLGVSLTKAILFSSHLLLSTFASFAGILHGVQKRLGGPVDFPSFYRRNAFLYRVEEFRKADPDPFVNLSPLGGQTQIQSPRIMLRPFLHDQPSPDEGAYHPGGRAFLHRKNVMEFRQGNLSFPGYGVEDEKLGESQVQAKRFFLLAAA